VKSRTVSQDFMSKWSIHIPSGAFQGSAEGSSAKVHGSGPAKGPNDYRSHSKSGRMWVLPSIHQPFPMFQQWILSQRTKPRKKPRFSSIFFANTANFTRRMALQSSLLLMFDFPYLSCYSLTDFRILLTKSFVHTRVYFLPRTRIRKYALHALAEDMNASHAVVRCLPNSQPGFQNTVTWKIIVRWWTNWKQAYIATWMKSQEKLWINNTGFPSHGWKVCAPSLRSL
jgi:hypothetical protein